MRCGKRNVLDVVLVDLGGTLKEQSLCGGHLVENHPLDAGLSASIISMESMKQKARLISHR
jgi:hypothetical protein